MAPVRPGTSLLLFPTKALAQDQLRALSGLEVPGLVAATYDGDTGPAERTWVRANANVVLTNPEMLHHGVLPHHAALGHLPHAPAVRRGRRAARAARRVRHARRPPAAPPAPAVRALRGRPDVRVLVGHHRPAGPAGLGAVRPSTWPRSPTTARRGATHVRAVEPARNWPQPTPAMGPTRRTPVAPGARRPTARRRRSWPSWSGRAIARSPSAAAARAPSWWPPTCAAGCPPSWPIASGPTGAATSPLSAARSRASCSAGSSAGVVATTALELGIDVGGLDACVLNGFPGTIASMWQQAGRAGRESAGRPSSVLVAGDDQLDQWLMSPPRPGVRSAARAGGHQPGQPLRAQRPPGLRGLRAAAQPRRRAVVARPARRGRARRWWSTTG